MTGRVTFALHSTQNKSARICRVIHSRSISCRATDLQGGSAFGYKLLIVIFLSNCVAMFLQALSLKLGVVAERDLAQACRDAYPKVSRSPHGKRQPANSMDLSESPHYHHHCHCPSMLHEYLTHLLS